MKYYIGDAHLGHANIIRYDQRPFSNIDEMDRKIIKNWNDRITNNDDIYIVGDFIYRGEKNQSGI